MKDSAIFSKIIGIILIFVGVAYTVLASLLSEISSILALMFFSIIAIASGAFFIYDGAFFKGKEEYEGRSTIYLKEGLEYTVSAIDLDRREFLLKPKGKESLFYNDCNERVPEEVEVCTVIYQNSEGDIVVK